jgi:hypothetical protein
MLDCFPKEHTAMKLIFACTIALVVLQTGATALSQIKQWTDDQGVTHFGNEPPAAPKAVPRELKIRKSEPFQLSQRALLNETQSKSEKYLKELASDLVGAQLQMQLIDLEANYMRVGATGSQLIAITSWQTRTRLEHYGKLFTPIRADLLAFEQTIKEKNSGALPEWIKDNRDWRALDKEFQR